MSGYKEFEGKTLDEAIRGACAYYDVTRDKLEIDILNDAKSGIFGLMGTKKARVRARLVELSSVLDGLGDLREKEKQQKKRPGSQESEPRRNARREPREETPPKEDPLAEKKSAPPAALAPSAVAESPEEECPDQAAALSASEERGNGASGSQSKGNRSRKERPRHGDRRAKPENGKDGDKARNADRGKHAERMLAGDAADDLDAEEFNRVPLEQLDSAELETAAREIVTQLTAPFLGDVTINVTVGNDRVRVTLRDVEDPGLLIGRDGQTLASLQYLVTRMLSNRMKTLLRVQIDAGDYRERQDERLREMALSLAEKVKAGGRPQVTRPLSSYHRRVIHLTLQDDPQIQTHSKGEGEMKRVMVTRRKAQA